MAAACLAGMPSALRSYSSSPLSKLVELHGGKLSVTSEGLNKGTEIRFSLPAKMASGK